MSEILLKAEDARALAKNMKAQAADAKSDFNRLNTKLRSLTDSFKGRTQVAFDGRYEEWKQNASGLINALEGLGGFLDQAATAIEDVDKQLASQLRG